MKTTFIYARLEPFEDEIRYVGKSDNPRRRLSHHRSSAKNNTYHCSNWLNSLSAQGLEPRTEIIAEVPVAEWEFWEQYYIKYFRDCGFDLTNTSPGGEAGPAWRGEKNHNWGKKFSPEFCKKLSVSHLGHKHTPERIEKIAAGNRRTKGTPEYRIKTSISVRGRKRVDSTSGYVGVCLVKPLAKWRAQIFINGLNIPLGYYKDKSDAVFVRRLAENKYFL